MHVVGYDIADGESPVLISSIANADIILAMGPDGADDFSTQHSVVGMGEIGIWTLSLDQLTWGGLKASMD